MSAATTKTPNRRPLLRGAAAPDEVPRHESRLDRAIALAYDLPQPPSARELERISGNWRPYRTWATLLLRTFLEDQTGEIAGQQSCEWTRGFSRTRVSNFRWPFVDMASGADGAVAKGADRVHRYRLSRHHRHPAPADQDAAAGHGLRRCAGRRGRHCWRGCPAGRRSPAGCARQDSASGLRPAHFPRGSGRRGARGRADPARLRRSSAVHPDRCRAHRALLCRPCGFWVIETSGLDAALEWAGKAAAASGETIEVRPAQG